MFAIVSKCEKKFCHVFCNINYNHIKEQGGDLNPFISGPGSGFLKIFYNF